MAVYLGSLLGASVGDASSALLFPSPFFPSFPFYIISSMLTMLPLLFAAFSGLAFARLRKGTLSVGRPGLALPLLALAFTLPGGIFAGYFSLDFMGVNFSTVGTAYFGLFIFTLPIQILVFYAVGRRSSQRGRSFRAFGVLFIGAYLGTAIGTALAVGVYGQHQWLAPAYSTFSIQDGIPYVDQPASLVALLQGLDPIQSIPFLPFFALTLSEVGRLPEEPPVPRPDDPAPQNTQSTA